MDAEGPAVPSSSNGPPLGCSLIALGLIFMVCSGMGGALYLWIEHNKQRAPAEPVSVTSIVSAGRPSPPQRLVSS